MSGKFSLGEASSDQEKKRALYRQMSIKAADSL